MKNASAKIFAAVLAMLSLVMGARNAEAQTQQVSDASVPATNAATTDRPLAVSPEEFRQLRLDLSVPEVPSFTALGVSPANVSRPSNVRELVAAVSNGLTSEGRFQSGLALEFSPLGVLGNVKSDVLRAFRLSFATTAAGGGGPPVALRGAIGLRWSYSALESTDGTQLRSCLARAVGRDHRRHQRVPPLDADRDTRAQDLAAHYGLEGQERTDFIAAFRSGFNAGGEAMDESSGFGAATGSDPVERCRVLSRVRNLAGRALEASVVLSGTSPDSRISNFEALRATAWLSGALRLHRSRIAAQGEDDGLEDRDEFFSLPANSPAELARRAFAVELDAFVRFDYVERTNVAPATSTLFAALRLPLLWDSRNVFFEVGVRFNDLIREGGGPIAQRMEIPVGVGADFRLTDGTWLGAYFGGNLYEGGAFNPGFLGLANLKYNLSENRHY